MGWCSAMVYIQVPVYTYISYVEARLRLGAKPVAQELRDEVEFPYQLLSSPSTDSLAAG